MSQLLKTTVRYMHGGRISDGGSSSSWLIRTTSAPEDASVHTYHDAVKAGLLPLMDSEAVIYSITTTPIEVPGRHKKTRNDHIVTYYEDAGTHTQASGVDIALKSTAAQFFKYPLKGTAGSLYLRYVLTEAELKSDDEGAPDNETTGWKTRFETFATALPTAVAGLAGGKLVMPGPSKDDKGEVVALATYTTSARDVDRVEFERIVEMQVHKRQKSATSKRIDVMKAEIAELRTYYLQALEDAGGVAGSIAAEATTEMNSLGHAIFLHYTTAERLKGKMEKALKAYIK